MPDKTGGDENSETDISSVNKFTALFEYNGSWNEYICLYLSRLFLNLEELLSWQMARSRKKIDMS